MHVRISKEKMAIEKSEQFFAFLVYFGFHFGYLSFYVFTSIVIWPFFPSSIDFNKKDFFRFEYESFYAAR